MPDALYAPWRMDYLKSIHKPDPTECFLCAAGKASQDQFAKLLILRQTEHVVVMLNRYPYTSGHLLVSPRRHIAEMEELADGELLDLNKETARGIALLKRAIAPQGFNVGINLGRCAGAGLPGHLHQHIVPRWGGDVNFISVVGDIRIIPEALSKMYEQLAQAMGSFSRE